MTGRARTFGLIAGAVALPLSAVLIARALGGDMGPATNSIISTSTSSTSLSTSTTEATTTTTASTAPPENIAAGTLPSVPRPGEPIAASTPATLAAQIVGADEVLHDRSASASNVARQAHVQQVAYRRLVSETRLRTATYAALPRELRPVVEANVTAGAKLRALVGNPRTSLPGWRVVAPAPAAELLGYYKAAEAEIGVPWQYLAAIHLVETRMGRIRGTSEAGAQGPMQFLPATWKRYGAGGDINSNRDAIFGAARLLERNGAPGNIRSAVFSYNHDYRYVDAVIAYADRMAASEAAYVGYHGWQVYYLTTAGDVWLPEGYVGP